MSEARNVTATFTGLFGETDVAPPGGANHWVGLAPENDATPGGGDAALRSAPRSRVWGVRQWGAAPSRPENRSPYLHLAGFRSPASQLPTAIHQGTVDQEAKQRQLDEVLVRTQAAPSDGTVTELVYDGEGNRVVKKVDGWVTVYVGQHYVCQGTEQALNSGGELACAKLIYGNGQRIAMEQVGGKGATYFHSDHLGSTSVVTDENGTVEQELAYYPFGETRSTVSPSGVDVAYQYTGQEKDHTTGLYDYHARLYDPHLGRFISPDTLVPEPFNPQEFNRYSYVVNNPLKYLDPTGHSKQQLTDDELDTAGPCGFGSCGGGVGSNWNGGSGIHDTGPDYLGNQGNGSGQGTNIMVGRNPGGSSSGSANLANQTAVNQSSVVESRLVFGIPVIGYWRNSGESARHNLEPPQHGHWACCDGSGSGV